MLRKAKIIKFNDDKSRAICVDIANYDEIFEYISRNDKNKKKFIYITEIILKNLKNREVYDKEDIDDKSKNVTAMKFFKHGANDRIYCFEKTIDNKLFVVIASEIFEKKKSQKNTNKIKNIIHKVAGYEYEIIE